MSALEDVQTAITSLTSAQTELSTPATESDGDKLLASTIESLTALGYTVTPPSTDTGEEVPVNVN